MVLVVLYRTISYIPYNHVFPLYEHTYKKSFEASLKRSNQNGTLLKVAALDYNRPHVLKFDCNIMKN